MNEPTSMKLAKLLVQFRYNKKPREETAKEMDALVLEVKRMEDVIAERMFPILLSDEQRRTGCPGLIPWSSVAPYEPQAKDNHDQSLKTLASRGGLSPEELCAIMTGRRGRELTGITSAEGVALVFSMAGVKRRP